MAPFTHLQFNISSWIKQKENNKSEIYVDAEVKRARLHICVRASSWVHCITLRRTYIGKLPSYIHTQTHSTSMLMQFVTCPSGRHRTLSIHTAHTFKSYLINLVYHINFIVFKIQLDENIIIIKTEFVMVANSQHVFSIAFYMRIMKHFFYKLHSFTATSTESKL